MLVGDMGLTRATTLERSEERIAAMLSLLDIAERTQTGPKMSEMDWNMALFAKMSELSQRFDIHLPHDDAWFNMDEGLIERAFEAALTLISEMGVYCTTTERVVHLTPPEIGEALAEVPAEVSVGEGEDRRVLKQHRIEGHGPIGFCPGLHAPFDIKTGPQVAEILASMPRTDFLEGFNFTAIGDRQIHGLPIEAYGTRQQLRSLRQSVATAGRPGMAVVLYPLSTRAGALLAAIDPVEALRPTDGLALSILPDVKIEHDLLTAAIIAHEYGCFTLSASFAICGGFCGGVDGAIIEGIAKPIVAAICYRDYLNCVGVEGALTASRSSNSQPIAWGRSLVTQALNARTPLVTMALGFSRFAPGTRGNLIELAVRAIEAQTNGANLYIVRHNRAQMNAGQTPLEAQWVIEVADATRRARLDRVAAGRVCQALSEQLGGSASEGYSIDVCYDLDARRPHPAYQRLYCEVKDELTRLGLGFA